MSALKIVLVSDGLPGHFHLSDGICAGIARLRPIAITRLDVARPRWLPGRALSALTNAGLAHLAPAATGTGARPVAAADLVVSAGGDTLAANVSLSRTYRCPNIFYGSLRRYRAADFGLVLTSYAANAARPNHAWSLKPSAFDPDGLPQTLLTAGVPPNLGLLVGGDSGTVRYQPDDWDKLLALLSPAGAQAQRWIVSNSRRTPLVVSDQIAARAAADPGAIRFIDVRQQGAGTLAELFAACDAIAVGVDSSSMISEAIWARRPVVSLAPATACLPPLEQSYRDHLRARGWLADLPLKRADPASLAAALASVKPLTANPLDELSQLLASRLPGLFEVSCPP